MADLFSVRKLYGFTMHGLAIAHLWEPLLSDVLKGGRGDDREANKEDVGLRVRERSQSVIVLLSSRVKESKRVLLVSLMSDGYLDYLT